MSRPNQQVLIAALLAVACSSDHATATSHFATRFNLVSGDGQSAVVGTQLPNPLVVKVTDGSGNPVAGTTVNFVVTSGGGTVFGGAETTNGSGLAQELWTLGTATADSQVLAVRAVNSTTGQPETFAVFHATALAAAPATLTYFSGKGQVAHTDSTLADPVAVTAFDHYGNEVPGARVTWQAGSNGGSTNPVTSTTNAAGVGSARWTLGHARGIDTVRAVIGSLAPVLFTAQATGNAKILTKIAGDNQATLEGQALPIAPVVAVMDSDGSVASGVVVTFTVTQGGGSVAATQVTTDTAGHASPGDWTVGLGANQLVAASAGAQPVTFSAIGQANVTGVTSIVAMGNHTCATTSSVPICWGLGSSGELGPANNNATNNPYPVPVTGAPAFVSIVGGDGYSCGLTVTGTAYCWGSNAGGALGRGVDSASLPSDPNPQPVAGGHTFTMLSSYGTYDVIGFNPQVSYQGRVTCGLTSSGAAYCWGQSVWGALGNGQTGFNPNEEVGASYAVQQTTPGLVLGGISFASISVGNESVWGVSKSGALYCWGNTIAEFGFEMPQGQPKLYPTSFSVSRVVTAAADYLDNYVCALATSGTVYCWGYNFYGDLGLGTTGDGATPQPVAGNIMFTSITADADATCGLSVSGQAYCWGLNANGMLGTGTSNNELSPTPVAGGLTFVSISTSLDHTCAITTSGQPYCWGYNVYGEVGNGNETTQLSPVAVVTTNASTARVRARPRPTASRSIKGLRHK